MQRTIENIGKGKRLLKRREGGKLFSQGEEADAIYFVQTGRIELSVVSSQGKKVPLGILGPRDFLGEECLVEDTRRTSTATSLESSTVFRVEKRAMLQAIHNHPEFSERFMASLLTRNVNMEGELCDQLFNHSEIRLACALLKLARAGRQVKLESVTIPAVTSKQLARVVGTTPKKIISFMQKFKTLGLIDFKDDGNVTVMSSLLTDLVLHG
jgi:CRP/FNR family transcriptional regulator, cyclic AMP receptor protein